MNILDENIIKSQRELLKSWRIAFRQIGYEAGRKGMKDDEILPLLLHFRNPTFFTRDLGFYDSRFCHKRYCLVCMSVEKSESAIFVRRLLSHYGFCTKAKRMGAVIHISRKGINVWRLNTDTQQSLAWND